MKGPGAWSKFATEDMSWLMWYLMGVGAYGGRDWLLASVAVGLTRILIIMRSQK